MCKIKIDKEIIQVLEFENEDSDFWHFWVEKICKDQHKEKSLLSFPKRKATMTKKIKDPDTGKLKSIPVYEELDPPSFYNRLRNNAVNEQKYFPYDEPANVERNSKVLQYTIRQLSKGQSIFKENESFDELVKRLMS